MADSWRDGLFVVKKGKDIYNNCSSMTAKGISNLEKYLQYKNRRRDQAHVAMMVILK